MCVKAIVFMLTLLMLLQTGCNPGTNSFSKCSHPKNAVFTQLALLMSYNSEDLS